MQLNLMRFFCAELLLFGPIPPETFSLSHQNHCSFCASKLQFRCFKIIIKKKKEKKNLKIILKYTFLENSSKHELEEELRGAGREDGSSK